MSHDQKGDIEISVLKCGVFLIIGINYQETTINNLGGRGIREKII